MIRIHVPWPIRVVRAFTALGVIVGLLCLRPPEVPAETPAGCHCFRNRTYDPGDRFGVDDYLRATAVNSLMARYFGVSKKEIVMMRMNGIPLEEMLTAFFIGKRGRIDYRDILDLRSARVRWAEVLTRRGLSPEKVEPGLGGIITEGDRQIEQHLEDATLARYFSTEPAEIIELRKLGLDNVRDRVLALGLGRRLSVPAKDLARAYRDKNRSWGEMTAGANLLPEHMGAYIESLGQG